MELSAKRILLTGGSGFLGLHVLDALQAQGARDVVVPRKARYDLTQEEAVARVYRDHRPDVVIHLAAIVGGIGANCRGHSGWRHSGVIRTRPVFPKLSSPHCVLGSLPKRLLLSPTRATRKLLRTPVGRNSDGFQAASWIY